MNIRIKRLFSAIIDLTFFWYFFVYIIVELPNFLANRLNFGLFENNLMLYLFFSNILFYVFIDSLFKRSLGKFLLNLKVKTLSNVTPTRILLLSRSIIKFFTLLTIVGGVVTLVIFIATGIVWYDKLFETKVVEAEK